MNREQQEDGYGEVNIPIAILKHLDYQNEELTQVFCSGSEALLAWEYLLHTKTPAILQRYIFKTPMMPNVVYSKMHGKNVITEEAVKISSTMLGSSTNQPMSKFKLT